MLTKRNQTQKITHHMIPFNKQANESMQFANKMVVTFVEKEKESGWEGVQRRLASGNFYFLTLVVVTQICLLS